MAVAFRNKPSTIPWMDELLTCQGTLAQSMAGKKDGQSACVAHDHNLRRYVGKLNESQHRPVTVLNTYPVLLTPSNTVMTVKLYSVPALSDETVAWLRDVATDVGRPPFSYCRM